MNIKHTLFDAIVENGIQVLCLPSNLPSFHDSKYKFYATLYCGQLLRDTYNSKGNSFKYPNTLLKNAYASGVFTRFLMECMLEGDEDEKLQNTIRIITSNSFHNEEKLIGLLLDAGSEELKKLYAASRDLIIEETLHLTYQMGSEIGMDGRLEDIMSALYAAFLLGAHTDILKDIKI